MNGKQTADWNSTPCRCGAVPDDAVAQAVHGLGGLLERPARVAVRVRAVEPQPALAAQLVAALDLEHQHAQPGRDDEEVDLALHLPAVVGEVLRVQHGPGRGAGPCAGRADAPPAPPPAAARRRASRRRSACPGRCAEGSDASRLIFAGRRARRTLRRRARAPPVTSAQPPNPPRARRRLTYAGTTRSNGPHHGHRHLQQRAARLRRHLRRRPSSLAPRPPGDPRYAAAWTDRISTRVAGGVLFCPSTRDRGEDRRGHGAEPAHHHRQVPAPARRAGQLGLGRGHGPRGRALHDAHRGRRDRDHGRLLARLPRAAARGRQSAGDPARHAAADARHAVHAGPDLRLAAGRAARPRGPVARAVPGA